MSTGFVCRNQVIDLREPHALYVCVKQRGHDGFHDDGHGRTWIDGENWLLAPHPIADSQGEGESE